MASEDTSTGADAAENTAAIKTEPAEILPWRFSDAEKVNLLSDDEGDDDEMVQMPRSVANLSLRAAMLARQQETVARYREERAAGLIAEKSLLEKQSAEAAPTTSNEHFGDDEPAENAHLSKKSTRGARKKSKKHSGNDDPEAEEFKKVKADYLRKKKAHTLAIEDEIAFIRAESAEGARLRKIAMDEEFNRSETELDEGEENDDDEEGNGLFVSPMPSYTATHSDDEDEGRPKKRRRPILEESEDDRKGKKAKKTAANKSSAAKKRGPAKNGKKATATNFPEMDFDQFIRDSRRSASAKTKGGAPKQKTGRRKKELPTMTNVNSILGTDVFSDSKRTAGLAQQPTFDKANRRTDAMKQLLASVPTEDQGIAKSDKKFLDDSIKAFTGHGAVKAGKDGHWILDGLSTSLKHYQVLGIAFMRKRENSGTEPKGGILADEMGLGKTIMMLGNIVNGKAGPEDPVKATLIVAAPALVAQWNNEIRTHCRSKREGKHGIGRVMRFHAGHRLASNEDSTLLEESDIVLTTYSEVSRSYPKVVVPPELTTAVQKDAWWREYYEKNKGLLHSIKFHRIVLDEAQAIKNHRSHTSMACRALMGKHRWAISGTPIQNTIKEFYPYFKFLAEPHTGSYKLFKENFCSPDDPDGITKLSYFLHQFLLRRTHSDTLFNARLLDLPQPTEHTVWLEFSDVERQIYEIVKKRFIQRINTISKAGGLEKQYSHIWSMLLRLRQICGHVLLVQGTVMDLLEREDFEKLNSITQSEDEMNDEGTALLLHLRAVLRHNTTVKVIDGTTAFRETEALNTGVVDIDQIEGDTGGKHGSNFRFHRYLDSLRRSETWGELSQRTMCCGCRQPPRDPQFTTCFHIYCYSCIMDLAHLSARRGHDQARCSECGEAYASFQPCVGLEAFQARPESTSTARSRSQATSTKKKGKYEGIEDWICMPGEVYASAKTRAVKAQVLEWMEADPEAKIIIYTQFLDMVRILAKVCQTEKWKYCEYHGTMSHESREKSIIEFDQNPEKKILLASLRAGGEGLNLTMASRTLIIDPWFNQAVEQQAFCRTYRIRQTKETKLTRLYVRNSIDEAMHMMKDRKTREIAELMSSQKNQPGIRTLMRLFGPVEDDEEGRPFIYPDATSSDDPEHLRLPNVDNEDEEGFMGNEA